MHSLNGQYFKTTWLSQNQIFRILLQQETMEVAWCQQELFRHAKSPVRSSPPTHQRSGFSTLDAPPTAQLTVSKHWSGKLNQKINQKKNHLNAHLSTECHTDIVNEALDFPLHTPVAELDFAQFVSTHECPVAGAVNVLLDNPRVVLTPRLRQRTPAGRLRVKQSRILFALIVAAGYRIRNNIHEIWNNRSRVNVGLQIVVVVAVSSFMCGVCEVILAAWKERRTRSAAVTGSLCQDIHA